MKCFTLYQGDRHRWLCFGQDPERPEQVIDTNQFLIDSGDESMMIDPGGTELFPAMTAALTRQTRVDTVRHLLISHQDPDVASSLPLWRQVCAEDMTVYLSWMWAGFVSHFEKDAVFHKLPDEGEEVRLGNKGVRLKILPAHYLHSPGNYCLYDPEAKILFSGDIGAALVPQGEQRDIFVQDFNRHIQYMEGFHRRWMGSRQARDGWVRMVRNLDIDILAPQHGLLFQGDDVQRFLDWFSELEIGSGVAAFDKGG